MQEFDELVRVSEALLAPDGCPWDREQTIFTLQPYLLEETHELLEAIDENSPQKIIEELGDVLYELIFIAKLGERDQKFSLKEAIHAIKEKLIRRHPHVFGEQTVESSHEVLKKWEEIKKKEGKKNPIEGIPPSLPSLSRAQKVIGKLRRAKSKVAEEVLEDSIGTKLWDIVKEAEEKGIDAESELRRICLKFEENFKLNN